MNAYGVNSMNAGELVISLILQNAGFNQGLADSQSGLDATSQAAQKLQSVFDDAVKKGEEIENVTKAYAEAQQELIRTGASKEQLDRLAEATKKLGVNVDDVARKSENMGAGLKSAASKGMASLDSLIGMASKLAGMLGVGLSIKGLASTYLDEAKALKEYGDSINANIEDVQAWETAVKNAGGNSEDFKKSLVSMSNDLKATAETGNGKMLPFLNNLGIRVKEAAGKTKQAMDILPELADKFEKLAPDKAKSLGEKMGIDKGTIELLLKGKKATEEAVKAGKAHLKYTKADMEAAKRANDALDKMKDSFMSLAMRAISPIIPLVAKFAEVMQKVADWIEDNREAVIAFFVALGIVLTAKAIPAFIKLGMAVSKAFGPLTLIAAIIAALAIAFDELWAFASGGDSVLERMMVNLGMSREAIEKVRDVVKSVIGFFVDLWDALTGDPESAEAAWGRVKATWEEAISFFKGIIETVKSYFTELFTNVANTIKEKIEAIKNFFAGLGRAIRNAILNMIPGWAKKMLGIGEEKESASPMTGQTSENKNKNLPKIETEKERSIRENQENHSELYQAWGGAPSPETAPKPEAIKAIPIPVALAQPAAPNAGQIAQGEVTNNIDNTKNTTNTTNIGTIQVQTQATDAQGIASGIGDSMRNVTAQANGAFGA